MNVLPRRAFLKLPLMYATRDGPDITERRHVYYSKSFQSIVEYDEDDGCVRYRRAVGWYDPVSKQSRSKLDEEIFITDSNTA